MSSPAKAALAIAIGTVMMGCFGLGFLEGERHGWAEDDAWVKAHTPNIFSDGPTRCDKRRAGEFVKFNDTYLWICNSDGSVTRWSDAIP